MDGVVVGIASYGNADRNCVIGDVSAVLFTRVASYLDWVLPYLSGPIPKPVQDPVKNFVDELLIILYFYLGLG